MASSSCPSSLISPISLQVPYHEKNNKLSKKLAVVIHLVQRHPFDLSVKMTGIAALGGVVAAITVFSMILAFRLGGEGSILFPIAGLSVIVAVILSYIVYREPITATKMVGLGLGISSIIMLSR